MGGKPPRNPGKGDLPAPNQYDIPSKICEKEGISFGVKPKIN